MSKRILVQLCACWLFGTALLAVTDATPALRTSIIQVQGTAAAYTGNNTLLPEVGQLYQITTPSTTGVYYNIRIQVTHSAGHVGFYCNPGWGGQPDPNNQIASPGNAVWKTEDAWYDELTISANDALYLPSNTSASSAILSGLASSGTNYQPAFNCTAYNPSNAALASFTVTISMDANNRTLPAGEQESMVTIYNSCCQGQGACATWKARAMSAGVPIYQNFCQLRGQYCTPQGRLQKLDLSSNMLNCSFPVQALQQFSSLQTLSLASNPGIMGQLSSLMFAVSNSTGLHKLDLSGASGLQGPLAGNNTTQGLCTLAQNGLQYLDLSEMNLTGTIPSCLLGSPGKLAKLGLSDNRLTGTIPDVIPTNSSLYLLAASTNNLSGPIPASITNAGHLLQLLLFSNQLNGTVPAQLGSNMSLLQLVQLYSNALTGTLPTGLATSTSLLQLDLHQNNLTDLPDAWVLGFANASSTALQQLDVHQNALSGPFPAALANFSSLLLLYANNNSLTGSLPGNSSVFKRLRVLDVSYNRLSGSIPAAYSASGPFNSQLAALRLGSTNQLLQQVFNLAHNNFSGAVPTFLAQGVVPNITQSGVSLLGNNFSSPCANSSFTYLDICTVKLNTTASAPAAAPAASAATAPAAPVSTESVDTPAATAAASPAISTGGPPSTSVSTVDTASGREGANAGGKGISSGAIAGIVIAAVVVIAAAAGVATWYVRRGPKASKRGFNPVFTSSSSGFSRFQDF